MAEAQINIAPESPIPIYRQIVDQVRMYIENEALAPGDSLPSVRSLATQLGIHFNTVAEAYRDLAEEGWIEVKQGRRATVRSTRSALPAVAIEAESLRQRLRHLLAEMRLKGVSATTIAGEVDAILWR